MRRVIFPGVLNPPSDCWMLADFMRAEGLARGARVLDVFTGSGALAISAALAGAVEATAVDITRRAVLNARLNARLNRVRVRVLRGDLFSPVGRERFDLILANPPYIPSATDALPRGGPAIAWDAGRDGRLLLDRLCAEAHSRLEPGGTLLIVHSELPGEAATLDALRAGGLSAEVVQRRRGGLGPVVSERSEMLERQGLLPPGAQEEEMLVFRAQRTDAEDEGLTAVPRGRAGARAGQPA